jgi:hypothetical protein
LAASKPFADVLPFFTGIFERESSSRPCGGVHTIAAYGKMFRLAGFDAELGSDAQCVS